MFTLIKHFSHWKHLEIGHLLRFLQELGRFGFSTALIKDTEYAIFKHTLIWPSLSLSCWVCVSWPSCERCSNSCHRNPSPEEALLVLKCSDGCYLHVFVRGKTLYEFRLKHTFQACWDMLRTTAAVVCSLEMSESLLSISLPPSVKVFKACQDFRYIFRCWNPFYLLFL